MFIDASRKNPPLLPQIQKILLNFCLRFIKKRARRVINLKGADMIARNKTLIVLKSTFKYTLSSPHVLIVNK